MKKIRETENITGLTLLEKVQELPMTFGKSGWSIKKENESTTHAIRIQQIRVLLSVFMGDCCNPNDLDLSINSVLNGDFISQRKRNEEKTPNLFQTKIDYYSSLFKKMDETIQSKRMRHSDECHSERHFWLKRNYCILLESKTTIERAVYFMMCWTGVSLELPPPLLYALKLTEEIKEMIHLEKINEFLSLVIDPIGKIISRQQLIAENKYPEEDVYDIEFDEAIDRDW